MIHNPVKRSLFLVRRHWLLISIGASFGLLSGVLVGLVTPRVYESQAYLQLRKSHSVQDAALSMAGYWVPDNRKLRETVILAKSKEVLVEVIRRFKSGTRDIHEAFPNRYTTLDIKGRIVLMGERLKFIRENARDRAIFHMLSEAELVILLRRHMLVRMNQDAQTIELRYTASTPAVSQRVNQLVADVTIDQAKKRGLAELMKQEQYLEDTIRDQMDHVSSIESELQQIIERYPEVASLNTSTGSSAMATLYLQKRDRLSTVSRELSANQRLMSILEDSYLKGGKEGKDAQQTVSFRLVDEINQLRLKKLEYSKVVGYGPDHPLITRMAERIENLRRILEATQKSDQAGTTGIGALSYEQVMSELGKLKQSNQKLVIQKDLLEEELKQRDSYIRKGLRTEFEVAAFTRELGIYQLITTELRKNLEKVRMQLAGSVQPATVLAPATMPGVPATLSVLKRAIFGFAAAAVFVFSFLFLLDLVDPVLLSREELDSLGIKQFRAVRMVRNSPHRVAAILDGIERKKSVSGSVMIVQAVSMEFDVVVWLKEAAQSLKSSGGKLGIAVVSDRSHSDARFTSILEAGIEVNHFRHDDMPGRVHKVIERMASGCDRVLVVFDDQQQSPTRVVVERMADELLYILEVGKSRLRVIEGVNLQAKENRDSDQYAVMIAS